MTPEGPVTIERLAAGGDGVGHLPDGLAVFVPRTAPGDVVTLTGVRRHRRHAFAQVAELVRAGEGRVEPRCAHYVRDACGGCQWQHLSAAAQLAARSRIAGDALRRIGKLDVPDPPVVPGPRAFGYRGTITLAIHGYGADRVVGLHRLGDASVFPLERCEIAEEPLNALWGALRSAAAALPEGDDVRVVLRAAPGGGLQVVVRGGGRAWGGAAALASAAAARGLTPTVWWQPEGGAVRRMAGPEADPASVAFEQANAPVADALHAAVLEAIPPGGGRLLDLYAGDGAVGLEAAARGREVVTVEVDQRAVRLARARAEARGLAVRALAARVEDVVADLLPAEVVVANPPRTGLEAGAAVALRETPPACLIYVSCDPATLARDLGRLRAEPARLALVRCYDMFPQTAHVETLAVLLHAAAPAR